MTIGQGLNMLVPNLQNGNIVALAKVIKSATAHHKKKPQTDEELETVLEDIAKTKVLILLVNKSSKNWERDL